MRLSSVIVAAAIVGVALADTTAPAPARRRAGAPATKRERPVWECDTAPVKTLPLVAPPRRRPRRPPHDWDPLVPFHDDLEPHEIVDGMQRVKSFVHCCYRAYREKGLVSVEVTIAPSGRVESAQTTGPFAGTPTGRCVEGAVRLAVFRPFDPPSMTLTYPFTLVGRR